MTNYERIKQMGLEEMAGFVYGILNTCRNVGDCAACRYFDGKACADKAETKKWLESEVTDNA